MGTVVRPDLERRLNALRNLKRLLDEAFRVPGTKLRFGWDPLIGMVPWVGDLLTGVMSAAILLQAHQMRIPLVVRWRMLLNVVIDVVIGIVPFLGDVADFFWKSNSINFALLERHAAAPRQASAGDWLFVVGIVAAAAAVVILPFVVMYWLVHVLMAPRG
jgi:hypothetical protein